jgi:hypothetical protein
MNFTIKMRSEIKLTMNHFNYFEYFHKNGYRNLVFVIVMMLLLLLDKKSE